MSEPIFSVLDGQICCLACCGTTGQKYKMVMHIVLQSGFSETVLRLLLSSFCLPSWYQVNIWKKNCSETVYISLSCLSPCWMMCCWDAVPACWLSAFTGSPAKSYRAVSKHLFLWLWKCSYSAQTWPFLLRCCWLPLYIPAVVVGERLHKCRGTHLPNTREISAVQPSAYAQAGRVAGKQHLKATTGSKMEPWWETKIFRWKKRARSSLDQRSCNYQKLLQRCPSA